MIHLEVVVHPVGQPQPIIYRNVECVAMDYIKRKNKIAVYENFKQWVDKTPGYYFVNIVSFTYFDDCEESEKHERKIL